MSLDRSLRLPVRLLFALIALLWAQLLLLTPYTHAGLLATACLGGGALLCLIAWGLRRILSRKFLLGCLLLGQIALVTRFNPHRTFFFAHLALTLIPPAVGYRIARDRRWALGYRIARDRRWALGYRIARDRRWALGYRIARDRRWALGYRIARDRRWALAVFGLCLTLDLVGEAALATRLRNGLPHPSGTLGISTRASPPIFPRTRAVSPLYARFRHEQEIRYLPLLSHRAYAFSGEAPPFSRTHSFDDVRRGNRWNSFLLERGYFSLIHSGEPSAEMKKMFAVGERLIQFRRGLESRSGLLDFHILDYDYDDLTLRVTAPGSGFLYWSDGYDPAWKATVRGKPAAVLRASGNFKAVAIPAGESVVRFTYRPTAFLSGILAFYSTLAAVALSVLFLKCKSALKSGWFSSALARSECARRAEG